MAFGHTRTTLREAVARYFGLHEATATGGSVATVVDTKLTRFANDYWINHAVYIKTDAGGAGAAPQGETSYCTDFVASTGTLTVKPDFTAAPASGDTYQLYQHVTPADINQALNLAVAGGEIATSLVASSTTLDYHLTGAQGLWRRQQIIGVYRRVLGRVDDMPYQIVGWELEDAEGLLTLRLPYLLNTNDSLWITYWGGENLALSADTDMVNLPLQLVRLRASMHLVENLRARQNQAGADRWGQDLRYLNEELAKLERGFQRAASTVRKHHWAADFGGGRARADEALGLLPNYGNSFADWP